MDGYPLAPGRDTGPGRMNHIRFVAAPGITHGGNLIHVNAEVDHHGTLLKAFTETDAVFKTASV
jgi:hypothetical protein